MKNIYNHIYTSLNHCLTKQKHNAAIRINKKSFLCCHRIITSRSTQFMRGDRLFCDKQNIKLVSNPTDHYSLYSDCLKICKLDYWITNCWFKIALIY